VIKFWQKQSKQEVIHYILSWNKEELPQQWKESFTIPIYKNGDKTDYSNYREVSLLPIMFRMLFNVLVSQLTPYKDEITGNHQWWISM